MAENDSVVRDGSLSWDAMPFQVAIGEQFSNLNQVMAYRLAMFDKHSPYTNDNVVINTDEKYRTNKFDPDSSYTTNYDKNKDNIADLLGLDEEGELYSGPIMKPYFRDTRVGGNDAINCLWQFNRDDDIMHPINTIDKEGCIGLGRVYSSTTEQNQQICWFTFGVPYYTKLAAYYKNAFDKDLIKLNQDGYNTNVELASIFGTGVGLAFSLAVLPIKWTLQAINETRDQYPVNRFYELRACMPLYYKYVDSILAQWLVSSGLYDNGPDQKQTWVANADYLPDPLRATGPGIHDITKRRAINAGLATATPRSGDSISEVITETVNKVTGLSTTQTEDDPETRANKWLKNVPVGVTANPTPKYEVDNQGNSTIKWTTLSSEDLNKINQLKAKGGTSSSNSGDPDEYSDFYASNSWWESFKSNALGANNFVGFRVEKSVDASESFSNSTSPSSFAESFNSSVRESQIKQIDLGIKGGYGDENGNGSWADKATDVIKSVAAGVSSMLNTLTSTVGLDITGLSAAVTTGAYLDIPEQYSGSDFNKSHSISFQLRSPYGDKVSIYQSIIVPLAMILAGALPRQTGENSYTQPFLCRCYCKGMFSIPMGIIDSISIRRGSSEFGWTYDNLPTCVDVTVSIKDMSPVMYMGIADSTFTNIFKVDNSFKEYMLTLSGTGLWERISLMARWRRNAQFTAHRLRNYYFNPAMWSNSISQFAPVRVVAAMIPRTTISRH